MKFARQLWFVLTRWRRDADLREEMRLHVELRAAANARCGQSVDQAARLARRRFGNELKLREDSRDAWGLLMIEHTMRDAVYAARQLARRPAWAITVVLTLAIGVGSTSGVFALMDALLFKPGVGDRPDRLVWIASVSQPSGIPSTVSYPDYTAFRDQAKTLATVMAFSGAQFSVGGDTAEMVYGQVVTGNYFDVLHIPTGLGRAFGPGDDRVGAPPAAVLSDAFWRSHFAADPAVIGERVPIGGAPFTVIGVMPARFTGTEFGHPAALWIPLHLRELAVHDDTVLFTRADRRWLRVIARLVDGASVDRANAEANVIAAAIAPADVAPRRRTTALVTSTTGGLHPSNRHDLGLVLGLIAAGPILVLLVSCANVGNMVMAQYISRSREFALRRAIGASRSGIVRQLLIETLLLAALAAIAGLIASQILTALVTNVGHLPPEVTRELESNARVVLATLAIAVAACGLFGIGPALAATRFDLFAALHSQNAPVTIGRGRSTLRSAFLVTQVAISLVLVIASGLFLQSLTKSLRVDAGFVARGAVSVTVDPGLQGYSLDRFQRFTRDMVDRASSLPGVTSAAATSLLPLGGSTRWRDVASEDDSRKTTAIVAGVTARYFDAMAMPLLAGRSISVDDVAGGPPVAVVNDTLAKRLWPAGSPVGHEILDHSTQPALRLQVVGLVRDGKYGSLDEDPTPGLYVSAAQRPMTDAPLSIIARTSGDETSLVRQVVAIVRSADPDLASSRAESLSETVRAASEDRRAALALVGVSGVIAVLVAAIGVYGVAAHDVSTRTREVGIRIALGARVWDVLQLFVGQSLRLTAVGVVIGIGLSALAARVLARFLFGLAPTDLMTFVGGAALLTAVAAVASYLPARQAAHTQPATTLRQ